MYIYIYIYAYKVCLKQYSNKEVIKVFNILTTHVVVIILPYI